MYKTIVNPETGRKVKVSGKIGQKVLNNYKKQYGGVPLSTEQIKALRKSREGEQHALQMYVSSGLEGIAANRLRREDAAEEMRKSRGKIETFFGLSLNGLPGLNDLKEAMKGNDDLLKYIADNYRGGIHTKADNGLEFFKHVKTIPLLNNTHESVISDIIKYLTVEKIKFDLNSVNAPCPKFYTDHKGNQIPTPDRPEVCCNRETGRVINIPRLTYEYGKDNLGRYKLMPLRRADGFCKSPEELKEEIQRKKGSIGHFGRLRNRTVERTRKFRHGIHQGLDNLRSMDDWDRGLKAEERANKGQFTKSHGDIKSLEAAEKEMIQLRMNPLGRHGGGKKKSPKRKSKRNNSNKNRNNKKK